MEQLEQNQIDRNTLILFTGDNGPWMVQGTSGGSEGLLTGRASGAPLPLLPVVGLLLVLLLLVLVLVSFCAGASDAETVTNAGYWNTGKGSTWEGGIHEAGFAYWPVRSRSPFQPKSSRPEAKRPRLSGLAGSDCAGFEDG